MLKTMVAAAALAIAGTPALAGARQDAKVLMPEDPGARAFFERFGFADAVITADGTMYMSGIVANLGEDNDFNAAFERAFGEIDVILKRAGASWDDIVEMTSYHTDLTSQIEPMAKVKARYIKAPYPAWSAIQVARLAPNRGITEIKLVLKLPKAK